MKVKRKDLELLMEYLTKEKPETVDVEVDEMKFQSRFSFTDAEQRACVVSLFAASINTTPDLTKTMKLYTRNLKLVPPTE